jgi:hypothetical protein
MLCVALQLTSLTWCYTSCYYHTRILFIATAIHESLPRNRNKNSFILTAGLLVKFEGYIQNAYFEGNSQLHIGVTGITLFLRNQFTAYPFLMNYQTSLPQLQAIRKNRPT